MLVVMDISMLKLHVNVRVFLVDLFWVFNETVI